MMYPVYDIVLLPPGSIDERSISVSGELSHLDTEFILQKDVLYPHLSLYMMNLIAENVENTIRLLADIAAKTPSLQLEAMHYAHNFTQGMFEITYKENKLLTSLQQHLIAAINPLREGLRAKDPVGHILADWLPQQTGELRENLERYGYDEVGSFFGPILLLRVLAKEIPKLLFPIFPQSKNLLEALVN